MAIEATQSVPNSEALNNGNVENYGMFPYPVIRIVENMCGKIPDEFSLDWLQMPENVVFRNFVEVGFGCSIEQLPSTFYSDLFLSNITDHIIGYPDEGWTIYARQTREEWLRGSVINAIDGINSELILLTAGQLAPEDCSGRHSAPILRAASCVRGSGSKPQRYFLGDKRCTECPHSEIGCGATPLQESSQRVLIQEMIEKLGVKNIPPEARSTLHNLLQLQSVIEGVSFDETMIEATIAQFEYQARVSELDFKLQSHDANKLFAQGNRLGREIILRLRNQREYTEYSEYGDDDLVLSKNLYLGLTHVSQALISLMGKYNCSDFVEYVKTIYEDLDSQIEEMKVLGMIGIQRSIVRELFGLPQVLRRRDLAEFAKEFIGSMQFADRNSRRPVTARLEIEGDCQCVFDRGVISRSLLNILSDVANHGRRTFKGDINARVGIHNVRVGEEDFVELSVVNPGYLDKAALEKIGKVIYSRHDGRGHGNGKVSISNLFDRFYTQMGYPIEFIETILQGQWSLIDENGQVVTDPEQVDKDSTSLRWRMLIPVSIKAEP